VSIARRHAGLGRDVVTARSEFIRPGVTKRVTPTGRLHGCPTLRLANNSPGFPQEKMVAPPAAALMLTESRAPRRPGRTGDLLMTSATSTTAARPSGPWKAPTETRAASGFSQPESQAPRTPSPLPSPPQATTRPRRIPRHRFPLGRESPSSAAERNNLQWGRGSRPRKVSSDSFPRLRNRSSFNGASHLGPEGWSLQSHRGVYNRVG
jgi:hypothetical protein